MTALFEEVYIVSMEDKKIQMEKIQITPEENQITEIKPRLKDLLRLLSQFVTVGGDFAG